MTEDLFGPTGSQIGSSHSSRDNTSSEAEDEDSSDEGKDLISSPLPTRDQDHDPLSRTPLSEKTPSQLEASRSSIQLRRAPALRSPRHRSPSDAPRTIAYTPLLPLTPTQTPSPQDRHTRNHSQSTVLARVPCPPPLRARASTSSEVRCARRRACRPPPLNPYARPSDSCRGPCADEPMSRCTRSAILGPPRSRPSPDGALCHAATETSAFSDDEDDAPTFVLAVKKSMLQLGRGATSLAHDRAGLEAAKRKAPRRSLKLACEALNSFLGIKRGTTA